MAVTPGIAVAMTVRHCRRSARRVTCRQCLRALPARRAVSSTAAVPARFRPRLWDADCAATTSASPIATRHWSRQRSGSRPGCAAPPAGRSALAAARGPLPSRRRCYQRRRCQRDHHRCIGYRRVSFGERLQRQSITGSAGTGSGVTQTRCATRCSRPTRTWPKSGSCGCVPTSAAPPTSVHSDSGSG